MLDAAALLTSSEIIVPFLGDDDLIIPGAINVVCEIFKNKDIDILSCAEARFNIKQIEQSTTRLRKSLAESKPVIKAYEAGSKLVDSYCSFWGLGDKEKHILPPSSHPSCLFVRKKNYN